MCCWYEANTRTGSRVRSTCLCCVKSAISSQPSVWLAMCFRNKWDVCGHSNCAKIEGRSRGIVANTASREGRAAPVCSKKWPNNGSSITLMSRRCAKLYIRAVLQLRGPDHSEMITWLRWLSDDRDGSCKQLRCQGMHRLYRQSIHVLSVPHKVIATLMLAQPRFIRVGRFKHLFSPAIGNHQMIRAGNKCITNR